MAKKLEYLSSAEMRQHGLEFEGRSPMTLREVLAFKKDMRIGEEKERDYHRRLQLAREQWFKDNPQWLGSAPPYATEHVKWGRKGWRR